MRWPLILFLAVGPATLAGCTLICKEDPLKPEPEEVLEPESAPDCEGGKEDEDNSLCWQHSYSESEYDWAAASDYCAHLTRGDHTDWYLPSFDDFDGILKSCDWEIALDDEGFCDDCEESTDCYLMFGDDSEEYWTSTAHSASEHVVVDLGSGRVDYRLNAAEFHVRCIRDLD